MRSRQIEGIRFKMTFKDEKGAHNWGVGRI